MLSTNVCYTDGGTEVRNHKIDSDVSARRRAPHVNCQLRGLRSGDLMPRQSSHLIPCRLWTPKAASPGFIATRCVTMVSYYASTKKACIMLMLQGMCIVIWIRCISTSRHPNRTRRRAKHTHDQTPQWVCHGETQWNMCVPRLYGSFVRSSAPSVVVIG